MRKLRSFAIGLVAVVLTLAVVGHFRFGGMLEEMRVACTAESDDAYCDCLTRETAGQIDMLRGALYGSNMLRPVSGLAQSDIDAILRTANTTCAA